MSKKRYRNRSTAKPSSSTDWLWITFIGTCVVIVGILIFMAQSVPSSTTAQSATTQQSSPHYATSPGVRTLTFVASGTVDNDPNHAQVSLVQGALPSGGSIRQLTVLSDENCAPDGQGISHCLNRLSYGSGEITVRHNHRLSEVPCLQPGETLQLASA